MRLNKMRGGTSGQKQKIMGGLIKPCDNFVSQI